MDVVPPVDLTDWKPLLHRHNINPDELNHRDGDPYSRHNTARREINRTTDRVPFIYRHATPDLPEIHNWIDTLVAASLISQGHKPTATLAHGRSLLLLGPTGVGKTHQAYGALRDLAVTGVALNWLATSSADMYAALRPRSGVDSETEFRRYAHARLLLIDDLGAAKASEWTEEINFRLVNNRYENQLPTLFTSNVLPGELTNRVGDRVASRLIEMCDRVVITGNDRRRQAAA
ncbi:ATP-binding protein [Streptomyces sp. NPDC058405]|uniref:ATP-binding protein n=1 Tax=Streptomyces sp. NPDC058405 TaxID=3346482 RepID=UPI00365A80C3